MLATKYSWIIPEVTMKFEVHFDVQIKDKIKHVQIIQV